MGISTDEGRDSSPFQTSQGGAGAAPWSAVAAATAFRGLARTRFWYGPRAEGGSCCCRTNVVYNGAMPASNKVVRQTVGLPADTARQVRSLAKQRRLSANRIIVELVEEGIEAQKRKQKEFFDLAGRFRAATDPKEVARLGDDLGRMVFGD